MAQAIAVVFSLCALSFAAGCLLTYLMLRSRKPEQVRAGEPAVIAAESEPVEQDERLRLRLPSDFSTAPIHRNPVVGVRTLSLDEPVAGPGAEQSDAPVVPPQSQPVPDTSEFRRHLEKFEAARRRSSL